MCCAAWRCGWTSDAAASRAAVLADLLSGHPAVRARSALSPARSARPPMLRVVYGWAHFHHWLAHDLFGIRTEIEGAIPPGPYLIAVKHQSMFETIEMLLFARSPDHRPEARARRPAALRPADAALWRHPGRPRGRGQGAARNAGRREGGEGDRASGGHLSRRNAGRARHDAAAARRVSRACIARSACRSCRSRSTAVGCSRVACSSAAGRSTSRSARSFRRD